MFAVLLLGAILFGVPILAVMLVDKGKAFGLAITLGFVLMMVALVWYAECRPWVFDSSASGGYRYFYIGVIALIVIGAFFTIKTLCVGAKYGPTSGSQKDLEKELEMLTKLKDRQALICSLVPTDAEDPYTGKLATWQQLTDYRWCACWLAHNDRMKKVNDPAYWPHR